MLYYRFLLDTLRDYSFSGYANDISAYVKNANWQFGAPNAYEALGAPAYMEIKLNNASGAFSLEDSGATYYGRLRRGTMIRIQGSLDGATWVNFATLKIIEAIPAYTMTGDHEIVVKLEDKLQSFYNREFVAPLQLNVRIDEILSALHEVQGMAWPYESYYQFIGHTSIGDGKHIFGGATLTDFDTAETTLAFYGDNLDKGQGVRIQQYVKEAVQAEIFGLYWFSPRDELFHFISRYHADDEVVQWYVTTVISQVPIYSVGRDLVNSYSLSYAPRAIGTAGSVLWSSDSLPLRMNAQATRRIVAKYRNPDYPTASVGALAVSDLERGIDFIANSETDGSGEDWSRFIYITVTKGAASSELSIFNRKVGEPAYITTLQLKGTPLTAYNKETVFAYNDDSVYGVGDDESTGYDTANKSDTLNGVSDADYAQNVADFMVNAFGDEVVTIERLTLIIKPDDSVTQNQVLNRTIGDVINFVDSANGHDKDYMIVGEQHNVSPNTIPPTHTVTYTLRPSTRGSVFILDTSFSNEGDILAF